MVLNLPQLRVFFPVPLKGWILGEEHPAYFLSLSVQGETHTLEDPVGNVPCGVKVSFKDEAKAHGIAAQGGRVHGGPECVLKQHRDSTDTEQCLSLCMALQTAKGLEERGLASEILFLLVVLNIQYPENVNVLSVINWGWEINEREGGV